MGTGMQMCRAPLKMMILHTLAKLLQLWLKQPQGTERSYRSLRSSFARMIREKDIEPWGTMT